VCFDVADVAGADAQAGQGAADDPFLGAAIGGGDGRGVAVLVDGGADDAGQDAVAAGDGHRLAAQDDGHAALAADVTVGGGVKGGAAARAGHQADLGEGDVDAGVQDGVDAGHDGGVAVAGKEPLAGQVQRHQGTGAGRIQGEGGAFQAQEVGHAAGGNAHGVGHGVIGGEPLEAFPDALDLRVAIGVHHGQVEAGVAVHELFRRLTGVFQGVPDGLEDHALLGVHAGGFDVGDAEETGVEAVNIVDETAFADVGFAGGERVRVVEGVDVPAVRGDFGDQIASGAQSLEQFVHAGDAAGQPAANADDGNGLGVGG